MGLFKHKQTSPADEEQYFMDETFREELRNHARWHFESLIKEGAAAFRSELDTTLIQINADLRAHVARGLDEALTTASSTIQQQVTQQLSAQAEANKQALIAAQAEAQKLLLGEITALKQQHAELLAVVRAASESHEVEITKALDDTKSRLASIGNAQDLALKALTASAQDLQDEYQRVHSELMANAKKQEEALVKVFESNMATIIEHYVLEAFGEEFDLKSQLPSIIDSLEDNKQAIVDDMKL